MLFLFRCFLAVIDRVNGGSKDKTTVLCLLHFLSEHSDMVQNNKGEKIIESDTIRNKQKIVLFLCLSYSIGMHKDAL